jgi:hypothetical protein
MPKVVRELSPGIRDIGFQENSSVIDTREKRYTESDMHHSEVIPLEQHYLWKVKRESMLTSCFVSLTGGSEVQLQPRPEFAFQANDANTVCTNLA